MRARRTGEGVEMHAIVVYESHWGNTAAIAEAIAEGIGEGARAMPTSEATPAVVAEADLVVAGGPVNVLGLPTENVRESIARDPRHAATPPDLSHASLRSWLDGLPHRKAAAASFETRLKWSPGGATGTIDRSLRKAGLRTIARAQKFIVSGTYGPLRDGELERARAWGADLWAAMR
jgi:hypothetical protein